LKKYIHDDTLRLLRDAGLVVKTVDHPLLLEAVIKLQDDKRGELLPAEPKLD
jgi:hypothetical protein